MRNLTIFRLIDDVSSIESAGDKTGKIDVFATKKAPDPMARPFGLGYRRTAEFQIEFRQVLVLREAVFVHRQLRLTALLLSI